MGDGSGGALALNLVQTLIENNEPVPRPSAQRFIISLTPKRLINISFPKSSSVMSLFDNVVGKDILISRFGVNEIMKRWAEGVPLIDKRVSPIYGPIDSWIFIERNFLTHHF
jgi:hypothetical protein